MADPTERTEIVRLYPTNTQKRLLRGYFHGYEIAFNLANEYIKNTGICNLNIYKNLDLPMYVPNLVCRNAIYECVLVWQTERKRRKTLKNKGKEIRGKVEIQNRKNIRSMLIRKGSFGISRKQKFMDERECQICGKETVLDHCPKHHSQLKVVGKCPQKQKNGKICQLPVREGYQYCTKHSKPQLFGFYVDSLGPMKGMEKMDEPKHDFRIVKDGSKYYLHVPVDLEKVPSHGENTTALDPGVRKFQTGYCPETNTVTFFPTPREKLEKLLKRCDEYQAKENRAKTRSKRRKLKYLRLKTTGKVKRIVKDLRNQTVNILTKNNRTIIIGKLNSQKASQGKLPSSVNRMLLTLSHYKFRQHLKFKCFERNCEYVEVDERYTTLTCHNCNYQNRNVGGSEVYRCPYCGEFDRDGNAAINIYRKAIGEFPL